MSTDLWEEYGFPDVTFLTPAKVAKALLAAAKERQTAVTHSMTINEILAWADSQTMMYGTTASRLYYEVDQAINLAFTSVCPWGGRSEYGNPYYISYVYADNTEMTFNNLSSYILEPGEDFLDRPGYMDPEYFAAWASQRYRMIRAMSRVRGETTPWLTPQYYAYGAAVTKTSDVSSWDAISQVMTELGTASWGRVNSLLRTCVDWEIPELSPSTREASYEYVKYIQLNNPYSLQYSKMTVTATISAAKQKEEWYRHLDAEYHDFGTGWTEGQTITLTPDSEGVLYQFRAPSDADFADPEVLTEYNGNKGMALTIDAVYEDTPSFNFASTAQTT